MFIFVETKTQKQMEEKLEKLFSVSMFFKIENEHSLQERLTAKIIRAQNANEAFGIAYNLVIKELRNFNLAYQVTLEI